MGGLSPENAIIAISSLIMLSTMSGLLFSVLVQPRRNQTNLLFAFYGASLLLWSLIALAGPLEGLRFGVDERTRLNLLSAAIGLSAISFFTFIVRFVGKRGFLIDGMLVAAPIILIISLILLGNGQVYAADFNPDLANFRMLPTGYVVLGAQLLYVLAGFWRIISSPQEPVRQMRIPGLLMVLVFASLWAESLLRLPVGIVLATIAAARMGWVVLRLQLFNPMHELTDELRIANRDLRQTLTDLSAERAKSESLMRQLDAASQYRSSFLDQLGHRLRTPLNSIVGYSELLQSGLYGDLNEKQADRLGKLHRNTTTLLDVINHMLDLNAASAGKFELERELIALDPLLENVFADAQLRHPERYAVLTCELAPDLLPIIGDRKRVQQVLGQLVDNAIKFTVTDSAQPPEVEVNAVNVSVQGGKSSDFALPVQGWLPDGDWVLLSVRDQGIGIAPEEQGSIFDEFFQSSDKRAAELSGTGLGLAITKRVVELHDGTIWVKSLPEQGSTFFVALRASRGGV